MTTEERKRTLNNRPPPFPEDFGDAAISLGLLSEPGDSQYGKSRIEDCGQLGRGWSRNVTAFVVIHWRSREPH